LRRSAEIAACKARAEKIYAKHFLILIAPSQNGKSRLAIAVTTKIDKRASVRNLIKRRVREVFRHSRPHFKQAVDLVVVARRDVQSCDFAEYERQLRTALRRGGVL
jgi:ribonuclease P protein component